MPPIRARMDSSPARSVDTANSSKTGASSSDPQQQERSKHIEVCVRLRPLVIQKETSSSSFFHGTTPATTKRRKPGLPRPNASSRIPGSVRKAVEKLETRQDSQLEAATTTYAWDVVDDDTVTQSPTTEIILGRTHTYTLDSVYGPDCQTAEVYQKSVHDLVHAAMNGYHASVLAYGQTSTGKTHTMTGTVQEPGFIPLAIKQCFQCLSQLQHTNREYLLRVSMLEVYKEHIRDLLASGPAPPPVRLFEKNGQLQIKGLREEVVTTPEQVFAILAEGEARRQVGATHLNQHSSRSHVMVRLWIESRERATTNNNGNDGSNHAPQRESVRASTLSLVDLAGSESVRLTGSTERRAEGHYINQSLMALGKVVYALSESTTTTDDALHKKQPQHVPYRDSKLTRLLQPSLSGNAQVVLLCCISPLPSHIEESHNTFKFAIRAKKIPQKAVIQNVGDADEKTLLQNYREEIEDLRKQLQEADAQRRELLEQQAALSSETAVPLRSPTTGATAEDAEEEMRELMDAIQNMEKLILKTGQPQQPPSPSTTTEPTNGVGQQGGGDDGSTAAAPLTPDRQYATENGSGSETTPSTPKDDLRVELARIQGLLGSVLKKRSLGAAAAVAAPALASSSSEEELRQLRAQLEEQEVATSLRQADSSFLLAQLEEKDNLLAEVSKILEAVEERQAALEAENKALRNQLETMRIAARSRSVGL